MLGALTKTPIRSMRKLISLPMGKSSLSAMAGVWLVHMA